MNLDRTIGVLALALAVTSCGSSEVYTRSSTAASKHAKKPKKATAETAMSMELEPLSDEEVRDIIRTTSEARSLPAKREIAVVRLPEKEYREDVAKRYRDDAKPDEASASDAFLVGFDFLPPPDKRVGIASASEVANEQVAAFYDVREAKVYLPITRPQSEQEGRLHRAILAHEVHHALQYQHFSLKDTTPRNSDERLARLALVEGDAMVAMGAFLGAELGAPVGRTLRRIREATERVPSTALAHEQKDSALARALELARERLKFPYEGGMLFVSDVFRAGGFSLVDRMYQQVPTTTEHILHPEKYLAGELPAPIKDLAAPPSLKLVGSDTLGELQTRVLLRRCMDSSTADEAAAGWNGDRFFSLRDQGGHLGMAWVSAWDSEADAVQAEKALASATDCFQENSAGTLTITKSFRVQRKGAVVAFVRGLDAAQQEQLATKLLGLPGVAPTAVALTNLRIPARVELPEPEEGTLEEGIYHNEWLGLVGRVPKNMLAEVGEDEGVELVISRPDKPVFGGVYVSTRITSDEHMERTFHEAEQGLARALKRRGLKLVRVKSGSMQTPLGAATERVYKVEGTKARTRLVLVPICAGTGSIVFMMTHGNDKAKRVLDGWLESFRFYDGRNLRACDYLDPK
ncbi:MAG: hypothetical protein HOW73_41490 [Polyangiaceae bacterium]|nr:hypothetical protein [Polyangiaceae bacterium]